ncbi:MAG: type III pantothenate kinase [Verrucomicrobiia bacterium]
MRLLLDIGNTHMDVGVADDSKVIRHSKIPTHDTTIPQFKTALREMCIEAPVGIALCSVVPERTSIVQVALQQEFDQRATVLNHETVTGVGVDYPEPSTIGPDRLANAIAARRHFGAPAVVVDFGTAVTFDVVDRSGNYAGGIIAPGVAAMTDYLHEKTALLPRIEIKEPTRVIGKTAAEAMLIGAVFGYRGLIGELIRRLRAELGSASLPVIATGGYAEKIAGKVPEITAVEPLLTLEGLRLFLERTSS